MTEPPPPRLPRSPRPPRSPPSLLEIIFNSVSSDDYYYGSGYSLDWIALLPPAVDAAEDGKYPLSYVADGVAVSWSVPSSTAFAFTVVEVSSWLSLPLRDCIGY